MWSYLRRSQLMQCARFLLIKISLSNLCRKYFCTLFLPRNARIFIFFLICPQKNNFIFIAWAPSENKTLKPHLFFNRHEPKKEFLQTACDFKWNEIEQCWHEKMLRIITQRPLVRTVDGLVGWSQVTKSVKKFNGTVSEINKIFITRKIFSFLLQK